jgi:uncharacterized protein (TIGR03382 family)
MNPSLLLVMALGATSKLGPVVYSDTGGGVATVLEACPRVVKWVLGPEVSARTVNDLPSRCGYGTERVVAIAEGCAESDLADDPVEAANDCWGEVLASAGLVESGVWLELPHGDFLPAWIDEGAPDWLARFWARFADLASGQGLKPLVPAFGVPEASRLVPLAVEMKKRAYAWGWAAPAYSSSLSSSVCGERTGALGFRALRDAAGLGGTPLFLTESGLGQPGWKELDRTEEEYLEWLRWFDARLQEDPEVRGAALFQFGGAGEFDDYDLAPLAEELAEHVGLASIPAVPAGETDCGSGGADGGVPADGGANSGSNPGGGAFRPASPDEGGCGCQSSSAASLGVPVLFLAAGLLRRRERGSGD